MVKENAKKRRQRERASERLKDHNSCSGRYTTRPFQRSFLLKYTGTFKQNLKFEMAFENITFIYYKINYLFQ